MWGDRSFHDFVTQRQISDLVMRRVAEHVYDRPLINNVERADYVECLVELIMQSADPRWCLTETWDAWDVEHPDGARVEVKQSSALQSWSGPSSAKTEASPRFDISIREWDWLMCSRGEYHNFPSDGRRSADVYVSHGTVSRTGHSRIIVRLPSGSSSWWPRANCPRRGRSVSTHYASSRDCVRTGHLPERSWRQSPLTHPG